MTLKISFKCHLVWKFEVPFQCQYSISPYNQTQPPTRCRPKGRRCIPDVAINNGSSIVEAYRNIDVHVVNTDICWVLHMQFLDKCLSWNRKIEEFIQSGHPRKWLWHSHAANPLENLLLRAYRNSHPISAWLLITSRMAGHILLTNFIGLLKKTDQSMCTVLAINCLQTRVILCRGTDRHRERNWKQKFNCEWNKVILIKF